MKWFFTAFIFLLPAAFALEQPKGPVVLTISGTNTQTNAGKTAAFTMDMLAKLPQTHFVTKTPWYEKPVKFTGPLLKDVLAAAGARGTKITAIALNDYKVDIPFEDLNKYPVLLARLADDKPMAVRDKGPLFIVYPYDDYSELRKDIYYGRSAWQLSKLLIQ
ncbi:MAG: hypothetical protein ACRCU9_01535 [Iodobacter sp.]